MVNIGLRQLVVVFFLVLGASGCYWSTDADDALDPVDAPIGGKADDIAEGSLGACAALRIANEASFDELDVEASLDARAAQGIVDLRPFATLAELDAVPYVGPTVFARLVDYAAIRGMTCGGGPILRGRIVDWQDVHDEWRTDGPLAYAFWAQPGGTYTAWANGPGTSNDPRVAVRGPQPAAGAPSLESLPLLVDVILDSSSASTEVNFQVPAPGVYVLVLDEAQGRSGFVDFRLSALGWGPSTACVEIGHCNCDIDADCGAGAACRPSFFFDPAPGEPTGTCAPTDPGPYRSEQCDQPGGVYRTVSFTADEACAALDVLNHAPWTQLRDHLAGFARTALFLGPGESNWTRVGRWTSLAQFARQTVEFGGVGSFTMKKLKALAQTWSSPGEPAPDTVASTWADRFNQDGRQVVLERAVVTEALPIHVWDPASPDWVQFCAIVRDEPGAPNFLRVCFDNVCPAGCVSPMEELVGERVAIDGEFGFAQGSWQISAWPRRLR